MWQQAEQAQQHSSSIAAAQAQQGRRAPENFIT